MPPTPSPAPAGRPPATRAVALAPIVPKSVQELLALAEIYYKGGLTPSGCGRPEAVAAIIGAGMEIGMKPAAALNSIYIVNGKAALYGDAPLALVRASGLLESIEERVEGSGMDRAGVCTVQRKGDPVGKRSYRYAAADAQRAGLWGKKGPWTANPDRMLQFAARRWLLRDVFGDVLMGMAIAEEPEEAEAVRVAEVTRATADAPAQPAGATPAPATDCHGEVMIDDAQLAQVKKLMPAWLALHAPNPSTNNEKGVAWISMLTERFGVGSARHLTASQADELLATLREAAASPTAAVFAPGAAPAGTAETPQQPQPTTTAA